MPASLPPRALIALLLLTLPTFAESPPRPEHDFAKWEKTIAAFEQQDQERPPRPGGVLFIGSSTIRRWNVDQDMPELHALNRGFGGSELIDSVHFADRIVLPYKPKVIVLYAGGNDLMKGTHPTQIYQDFLAFVEKVHATLPETEICYLAIKPTIKRWEIRHRERAVNALIEMACVEGERLHYLNDWDIMLGPDGKPDAKYLVEDNLHPSEAGYRKIAELIRPEIVKLLEAKSSSSPSR